MHVSSLLWRTPWLADPPPHVTDGWGARPLRWLSVLVVFFLSFFQFINFFPGKIHVSSFWWRINFDSLIFISLSLWGNCSNTATRYTFDQQTIQTSSFSPLSHQYLPCFVNLSTACSLIFKENRFGTWLARKWWAHTQFSLYVLLQKTMTWRRRRCGSCGCSVPSSRKTSSSCVKRSDEEANSTSCSNTSSA